MSEVMTDEHGRPEPPLESGEVATLLGFLDYQRATLEWKCGGLSDEQLRVARPPSTITLGGLLKHMARVEDYWFTKVIGGQPMPEPWASAEAETGPQWAWHSAAGDSGEDLRALWAERAGRSRAVVEARLDQGGDAALSQAHPAWGGRGRASLRWVLMHMVEEYARHNGHADLIRESVDGQTGE